MKKLRTLFALLSLVTLSATAGVADPDRAWISLGSAHISDKDFEQINPGLFLTWEGEHLGYTVGAFRNSYGGFSTAATVGAPLIYKDDFELSLFTGLATYPGYADRFRFSQGDIVAIAGASLRYKNVFTQLFPGNGNSVKLTASFGVTFDLGESPKR